MEKTEAYFMKQAIDLAKRAREEGNEPFGAILVKDGEVVMRGANHIHSGSDPTFHAELGLIRAYCSAYQVSDLSEYTLYTSCEPCVMCSGAMVWANLGKVVYSVSHDQLAEIAGGNIMIACRDVFQKSPNRPEVEGPICPEEGLQVFEGYRFG
ncbi:nucleoside deaminase [Salisediminibacterium selenitireducens]|uniref:CMP/dCMP deaminase zinc-binding protein n=1 Tax=Bacillus selenitireducens (strain ATCC 700615 / DSM 15326 / MLS10) TaxID=439292 RepID=D6XWF0_BACIE|nr:nucleoside deaminase [Salisediminibacterium selenitireducens]ADH97792.1 CMP/dCMP deaminase zinc-binding protein [[Bacillus] selenitireducens MLS10]